MKALLVIMDGLGDVGERTPLSEAKKPTIDRLAKNGVTGLLHPTGRGKTPTSDLGHLAIFGYDAPYDPGRGPIEALGADIPLTDGDVALRCNLATVEDGIITDRRAGRVGEGADTLISSICDMELDCKETILQHTTQHRCVLVFRGYGLSPNISETDPHKEGVPVPRSKPLDDTQEAKHTADLLNVFTAESMELENHPFNKGRAPKANIIIARGPGQYRKIPSIRERFKISAACVAGGALYKGVARYVGMDIIDVPGANATFSTNLMGKAKAVIAAMKTHDLVFLHIKGTDNAGHDGDFSRKQKMIEKVDKMLQMMLPHLPEHHIVITGDHSTPVSLKRHSADPVPILIHGPNITPDPNGDFNELACQEGGLGHLEGLDVMPRIQDLLGKAY